MKIRISYLWTQRGSSQCLNWLDISFFSKKNISKSTPCHPENCRSNLAINFDRKISIFTTLYNWKLDFKWHYDIFFIILIISKMINKSCAILYINKNISVQLYNFESVKNSELESKDLNYFELLNLKFGKYL